MDQTKSTQNEFGEDVLEIAFQLASASFDGSVAESDGFGTLVSLRHLAVIQAKRGNFSEAILAAQEGRQIASEFSHQWTGLH